MKKITILATRGVTTKNDPKVLAKAFEGKADCQIIYLENLLFSISHKAVQVVDAPSGEDLQNTDLVIAIGWYKSGKQSFYREVAYTAGLYLQKRGVPVWNSEITHQRSVSKLSAMMLLALDGFPVPKTIFSMSGDALSGGIKNSLQVPFILKAAAASRGEDNHLLHTHDDAKTYITNELNQYIAQEFIPNDSDLRLVCAGGEPVLAIKRTRTTSDTHLNNTSQGAKAEIVDIQGIPEDLVEATRAIATLFGREMAGVDAMFNADKPSEYVILEVNAIPQLTSGSNVEQKLEKLVQGAVQFLDLPETGKS